MIKKVLILELKENYAIAMEEGGSIVRIKRKNGLSAGDKIYILPDDLFQQKKNNVLIPFVGGRKTQNSAFNKKMWSHMISVAAVFMIIVTVLLPQASFTAYACASFDGLTSIQMELNRKGQIIKIDSPDQSVSDNDLLALKGKYIDQVESEISALCKSESILVGYALFDNDNDSALEETIGSLFGNQHPTVYLQGDSDDMHEAKSRGLSLGKYLVCEIEDAELEKLLCTLPSKELEQLLKERPDWLDEYLPEDMADSLKDFDEDTDSDSDESESIHESEHEPLDDVDDEEELDEPTEPGDDKSVDLSDEQDEPDDEDLSGSPVSQDVEDEGGEDLETPEKESSDEGDLKD
ncbi:hypothetical protein EVA_09002 [gut metagenome]|uniref:RsgI N-terminal anti-sigma domain-containing protein n=1 Tax=gut metagenome TaxID=749906 RepID=J9G6L7_9ZZZZ